MNGGPQYKFTPAIPLCVSCKTQKEVDGLWDRLSKGGAPQSCGWVTDKFGLSWQIIPTILGELFGLKDREKAHGAMMTMLQLKKIDIGKLRVGDGPGKSGSGTKRAPSAKAKP